jgi:stearoyl-CoA desaturase (Delta-9 desaturase)
VHGSKRYLTGDESRNNAILAFFTMGEGWHNNHHAYQYAARQGFKWWEWDPTYYLLKGLSKIGIVWDLKAPPAAVLANQHILPPRVIERSAERLVATFSIEALAQKAQSAFAATPSFQDVQKRLQDTRDHLKEEASRAMANVGVPTIEWPSLPTMPSMDELHVRARQLFVDNTAMDQVVARAHAMLTQAVWERLGVKA